MLRTEPINFGGNVLRLGEDITSSRSSQLPNQTQGTMFAPRKLGLSKPRAGLGFKKNQPLVATPGSSTLKGPDDFRKMLLGGK